MRCNECGAENPPEANFCFHCGKASQLSPRIYKSPLDLWYCPHDSSAMQEMNPENQRLIPKENIEETLAMFQQKGLVTREHLEGLRNLCGRVFAQDPTNNFCVITTVTCSTCGYTSYASINYRPWTTKSPDKGKRVLNGSRLLRNGYFYLKSYKIFPLIICIGIIADVFFSLLGFGYASFFDSLSNFFADFDLNALEQSASSINITAILLDFILTCLLLSWTLASLRPIILERQSSENIFSSVVIAVKELPRVLALQVFVLGIAIIEIIQLEVMGSFGLLTYENIDSYEDFTEILFFFFVSLLLPSVFTFFGFLILLFTTYLAPALFFETDASLLLSLRRGLKFTRKYFWLTLGMTVIFNMMSNVGILLGIPVVIGQNSFVAFVITSFFFRMAYVFRVISFGWAYSEFKEKILR